MYRSDIFDREGTILKLCKTALAQLLVAAALITLAPDSANADDAPKPASFDIPQSVETIKVGLNYNTEALYEPTLRNENGFKFGYFDYLRRFHELGNTELTELTLRADTGFVLEDDMLVGAYHALLGGVFDSFEAAKGVASGLWGGFPAYINGEYRVLVGAYKNYEKAASEINRCGLDAQPFTGSEYSVLAALSGTSELQFLYDVGLGTRLAVSSGSETMFNGRPYLGDFEFSRCGAALNVINYVNIESYTAGVLPYEMNAMWPSEALKAQALCARTYAVNNINSYAKYGFDLRDDTYSQVYNGTLGATSETDSAVSLTEGKLVRYNSAACRVYYMSSSGGATDSGENVFSQRRAYLSGVRDPYESELDFYNKEWKSELLPENVSYRLNNRGYEMGLVTQIEPTLSPFGNVIALKITDEDGRVLELAGEHCFRALGLSSLHYTISQTENDDGETVFVFEGGGWGHNCGMSQWGAYSMAYGHAASAEDIIDFYFNGAYIA